MNHDSTRLLCIAGPCSLENWDVCARVAGELVGISSAHPALQVVFKGSFDKANRTSLTGERGPGLEEGLALLRRVKEEFGFPVLTDIHLPEQAAPVAEVCDVLQIPAFLSRQTDLLTAAAATGCVVNVKKGQFLSPAEMEYVVGKVRDAGAGEVWQTDRGTFFGYGNLVVDMRSFVQMAEFGRPVILDATHSVQLPGAAGGKSGGRREFVPVLAKAALAAGADGLFVETHPDPARAVSDAASQWPLEKLSVFLGGCLRIWEAARETNPPEVADNV